MNLKVNLKQCIHRLKGLNPQKSLKRLLSLWFILFALLPLLVIAGYSTYLFNQRINDELMKRLTAFEKGIDLELIDVEEKLRLGGFRHANDYYLMNLLRGKQKTTLESVTQSIIENYIVDRMSYFNAKGKHFLSVKPKRVLNDPEIILPEEEDSLSQIFMTELQEERQVVIKMSHSNIGFSMNCYTIMKIGKNMIGYTKETVIIDRSYSLNTKERTGLDIVLLDPSFHLLVSTLSPEKEEKFRYSEKAYRRLIDIAIGGETHRMLVKGMIGDNEKTFGYLGILVSRLNAQETLGRILNILILICAIITLIVLIFTRIASRTVLGPIDQLLLATQNIQQGKLDQTIAIPTMQEVGDLVNSFNNMSNALYKMKNELEMKVDQLHKANQELKSAQAQLVHSSKMVSLGQLVAGVAHELNNPISYTYSNINHLKEYMKNIHKLMEAYDEIASKLPKTEQKKVIHLKEDLNIEFMMKDIDNIIESCLDGTHRTKDIVTDLRNFSRLDEAEIKEVDLHEGLETTLKLLTSETKNRIEIHKEYGELPKISCYSSHINQVLMNILSNAIQAIEKKGEIWIKTKVVKNEIQISIQDSGSGISKENLSRIFDPFFTTKKIGKGTGLGLSISYGIIQKHHGDIKVESEIGKGSSFTIILPKKGIQKAETL